MKNSSKLIAAAATSAVVGAAVGILFAPEKGAETRKKIDKQIRNLLESVKGECSKKRLESIKQKLEKHQEKVEKCLQEIKEKLEKETRENFL